MCCRSSNEETFKEFSEGVIEKYASVGCGALQGGLWCPSSHKGQPCGGARQPLWGPAGGKEGPGGVWGHKGLGILT